MGAITKCHGNATNVVTDHVHTGGWIISTIMKISVIKKIFQKTPISQISRSCRHPITNDGIKEQNDNTIKNSSNNNNHLALTQETNL